MDILNKTYTVKQEVHLFSSDEKLKHLGYGEWVEECDKLIFEYLGYECMVQRVFEKEPLSPAHYFGGHLCGYVKIPKEHVLYGKSDMDGVDCHGGITYNDAQKTHRFTTELPYHWIGFDCAHSGDITPSLDRFKTQHTPRCIDKVHKQLRELISLMSPIYRNMSYCVNECIGMVEQLIEIGKKTHAN